MRRRGEVYVGTSGWSYPHWRQTFYPPRLGSPRHLAFLASRLPTVEVNCTFYSLVKPAMVEAWRASVPRGSLFAVKARYITH